MRRYVLDTSVGVKWFSELDEEDLTKALQLREDFFNGDAELLVPELFFVELANALRFNPRLTEKDVEDALASLWAMEFGRTELSVHVLREATRLAYSYKLTVYDAIFLAFAKSMGVPFITADYSLAHKIRDLPFVRPLRTFERTT